MVDKEEVATLLAECEAAQDEIEAAAKAEVDAVEAFGAIQERLIVARNWAWEARRRLDAAVEEMLQHVE